MKRYRRFGIGLGVVALAAYGLARIWLGAPAAMDRYAALDGDTIEVVPARCSTNALGLGCRPQLLRLYGVDAFKSSESCEDQSGQPWACGAATLTQLKALAAKPDFSCQIDPEYSDRRGRQFAVCAAAGSDVGATLVSAGLAFAYGRGARYLPLEAKAKAEGRGAWAGKFERPQYYGQGARG